MRTPEQQKWIDEAIKRGIVPGATIRDAYGNEGTVPDVRTWLVSVDGSDAYIDFDSTEGFAVVIHSSTRDEWATVTIPATSINDRVKDVLSRHPQAKEALKELFPDAFPDEPFEFGREFTLHRYYEGGPLAIAGESGPSGLHNRCLYVNPSYEMRTQEHEGRTVLTFHKKR